MTQTEMPQKIEHLKRFLIIRLLLVMIFILVSESLINLFAGQIAFPALNNFFRAELFLEKQSSGTNVFLLVRLAIIFILEEIEGILPGSVSEIFSYFSISVWKNSELFGKNLRYSANIDVLCSICISLYLFTSLYCRCVILQQYRDKENGRRARI